MNAIRTLLLLALSGLLAACVTGGQVTSSDIDTRADFSRYHSFAFSDPLGTNRGGADTLLSQRLKASAARQMQARGFVYQEQAPDLLINFHAKVVEEEYPGVTFAPMFGYYGGYRHGFFAAWPAWGYGMDNDTYKEGQLNIDLIDAGQKRQIWEAVVIGDAVRATGSRADAIVDAAVAKAFRKFPVPGPVAMPAGH
jgi:hypothetical protein